MRFLSRRDGALLAGLLILSAVPVLGGMLRMVELLGGAALAPPNPRALAQPLPVILHVLGSAAFCLLGAVQILPSLRQSRPGLHRVLGRIAVLGGSVSAGSGLWMTVAFSFPEELQGGILFALRILLSLWMLWLILRAVVAIRRRDIARHWAAMLRAVAIGQGAGTQTILGLGALLVTGQELLGFERDLMMGSAWALNLAIAEWVIRKVSDAPTSKVMRHV
ncbi:DUF2306 domain-containing protein [Dinoroseobacter sp. S76]|uniref:DUF2306 domain-containing protein n=1 Tax=Dinoroseobacter sp. S76 TaxID=3415124 RepID=UPI003C7CC753